MSEATQAHYALFTALEKAEEARIQDAPGRDDRFQELIGVERRSAKLERDFCVASQYVVQVLIAR